MPSKYQVTQPRPEAFGTERESTMMRGLARKRGGRLPRTRMAAIAGVAALAAGTAALAVATAGTPAKASPAVLPQSPAHYQGPRLTMIPAQHDITVYGYPKGAEQQAAPGLRGPRDLARIPRVAVPAERRPGELPLAGHRDPGHRYAGRYPGDQAAARHDARPLERHRGHDPAHRALRRPHGYLQAASPSARTPTAPRGRPRTARTPRRTRSRGAPRSTRSRSARSGASPRDGPSTRRRASSAARSRSSRTAPTR